MNNQRPVFTSGATKGGTIGAEASLTLALSLRKSSFSFSFFIARFSMRDAGEAARD